MVRPLKHPLRPLTQDGRTLLEVLARSRSAPADRIARAQQILAVAAGAAVVMAGQALAELIRRTL